MLCVDLTQEGVVITGNRAKALSASSAGEGLDVSTADSPSVPPTQNNADRP